MLLFIVALSYALTVHSKVSDFTAGLHSWSSDPYAGAGPSGTAAWSAQQYQNPSFVGAGSTQTPFEDVGNDDSDSDGDDPLHVVLGSSQLPGAPVPTQTQAEHDLFQTPVQDFRPTSGIPPPRHTYPTDQIRRHKRGRR